MAGAAGGGEGPGPASLGWVFPVSLGSHPCAPCTGQEGGAGLDHGVGHAGTAPEHRTAPRATWSRLPRPQASEDTYPVSQEGIRAGVSDISLPRDCLELPEGLTGLLAAG